MLRNVNFLARRSSFVLLVSAALCMPLLAQAEWRRQFGGMQSSNISISAAVEFDDGAGNALYAAGTIYMPGPLYGVTGVAKWDGQGWTPLADAAATNVDSLIVFNDGSGDKLFLSGYFPDLNGSYFNGVARWDGATLTPIGALNGAANAMAVYDDGSGPALFIGGGFSTVDGVSALNLAKWDGASWQPVGGGVNSNVTALCVQTTPNGPRLIVGGHFSTAGPIAANYVAAWNGTSWSPISPGIGGPIRSIAIYPPGPGGDIFVGGSFASVSGQPASGFARFDGSAWQPISLAGFGGGYTVNALGVWNDGSGAKLFFGADNASNSLFAAWSTGGSISFIANYSCVSGVCSTVLSALTPFNDGTGRKLFLGGRFNQAGAVRANGCGSYDGFVLANFGQLLERHPYYGTTTIRGFADAANMQDGGLLALGDYDYAGGATVINSSVVAWNGARWNAVGGPVNASSARSAAVFDSGDGPQLYLGGDYISSPSYPYAQQLLRSDGVGWNLLTGGSPAGSYNSQGPSSVRALLVHNDGTGDHLYAGGNFTYASSTSVLNVARYDGVGWTSLVGGASYNGVNGDVYAMASFDDGYGPALFIGGDFNYAGNAGANRIVRWNAAGFSPVSTAMGNGVDGRVRAFAVFDDGTGPALFVGGEFYSAGGIVVNRLAKWDGLLWHDVGGGLAPGAGMSAAAVRVNALEVFDDGTGPALYVGGSFEFAGTTPARNLARWNGTTWTEVGGGAAAEVLSLRKASPDGFPGLYVGGMFGNVGQGAQAVPANGLALWSAPDARLAAPGSTIIGQPLTWTINTPSGFTPYFFDVTFGGSNPGVPISASRTIPLNPPLLYLSFGPIVPSLFNGFLGVSDAAGDAQATLFMPPVPSFIGLDLTASFITFDFTAPLGIGRIAPPRATRLIAPPPQPTAITPPVGPTSGGTATTITGVGLEGVAWVRFGSKFASAVALGPGGLSATTPAGLAGTVDVAVVRPDGSEGVLVAAFTYLPPLIVAGASPASAPAGATIVVTGSGFNAQTTATIGGVAAAVQSFTTTQLTCVVPSGAGCDAALVATNPGGLTASTTFNPSPVITSTLFNAGTSAGGASFFLFGNSFSAGTTVTVGGAPASIVSTSATTLLVVAPPGAPGTATVVVSSTTGCTATSTYTYL